MDYISDIQKEKIMNALTEKRRIHTRGVRETGKKLSKIYGADAEKVDIACVFHDLYRGKNILELDKLVDEFAIDVKYKGNANLSHGKIAAKAAERDFGIKDREILDAISYHTTGRADMGLVEKIVFLSDAIEPGRDYPGVSKLRSKALVDLDEACLMSLEGTIKLLKEQGIENIDEDTVKARNSLIEKGKEE